MSKTTVSPEYQVFIPEEIREKLPLTVGQVLQVTVENGVISLTPVNRILALRGFAKGMSIEGFRDKTDRSFE